MNVMIAPDVWSGQDQVITVEDMENMPDDEFRYELDDGMLIVSPAPSMLHQLAVTRLTVILSAACPAGFVVLPGVGVNISKFQHRVPDVAVVRAPSLETFFQETPPELVVEVASPRTRLYDRNRKKDVYEGFGIPANPSRRSCIHIDAPGAGDQRFTEDITFAARGLKSAGVRRPVPVLASARP
jgi:Uma2 family endonuclease